MRRRDLIAASAVLPAVAAAGAVAASETPSSSGASLGMAGVGLQIIFG